jgi:hypothetical protein
MEIAVPGTGELVSLEDARSCVFALDAVRDLERQIREAKAELTQAIIAHSKMQGTKTLHLEGLRAEIRGGTETVYDAEAIEEGLREAGMPEDVLAEVVVPTVTYKVDARRAERAAKANPEYAAVIEKHKSTVEKSTYVSIRRG